MRQLTLAGAVLLMIAASLDAVPIREPVGKAEPDELPAVALDRLDKDAGLSFGDWSIWRYDEGGKSYFIVNQKTGLGMYLYWASNGWVNYRAEGTWYVLFPTGNPQLQDRRDLQIDKFLNKRPAVRVAPGKYQVQGWVVTVTAETIEFETKNVPSVIRLRAHAPEFTHNGRAIGGK